jgi:hypothetical protein
VTRCTRTGQYPNGRDHFGAYFGLRGDTSPWTIEALPCLRLRTKSPDAQALLVGSGLDLDLHLSRSSGRQKLTC